MSRQEIYTILKAVAIAATIATGIICGRFGIDMLYKGTTATIGPLSFSAGLGLLILGFVLIVLALRRFPKTEGAENPIEIWLGRNWLILIGIVLLAAFIGTHYKFPTEDKYEILVDLILIMVGLTAAVGYGIFKWISHNIEDRAKSITKESHNFTITGVDISLGYVWWQLYETERKRKEEMQKHPLKNERKHNEKEEKTNIDDYINYLESAIEITEGALDCANQLGEKEYEVSICLCKNNLAYYLAERHRQGMAKVGDKELARSYADYIYKRIAKYPLDRENWMDTCQFVWQQFPKAKG